MNKMGDELGDDSGIGVEDERSGGVIFLATHSWALSRTRRHLFANTTRTRKYSPKSLRTRKSTYAQIRST